MRKRMIAAWMAVVLAVWPVMAESAPEGSLPELTDPVYTEDDASPTGFTVTWDCVWFGSYPSCEITAEPVSASDNYAAEEGDVLIDPELVEKLAAAEWTEDETELDGVRYRRMKASDAVNAAPDRPQHYEWDGEESFHYFRYEPLKWRVIEVNGTVAMLMADRMPDCAPYNTEAEDVFWENCTMRSFLNGYDGSANKAGISYAGRPQDSFFGTAFSEEEKKAVVLDTVSNPVNYYFGTDCGADTRDYVYLLDEEEIFSTDQAKRHGFVLTDGINDPARRFTPTMYAKARGAWYSPVEVNRGNGFWFIRTAGYTPSNVNYVCDYGYIYNRGTFVTCDDAGIVPVIRVDLAVMEPEYAGTVSSDEISRKKVQAEEPDGNDAEGQYGFAEPVVEPDEEASSKQKTTWDCVWFGSYPSCEITAQPFTAVDDYAVEEGDFLVDPELVEKLAAAEWTDDEAVLDGVRYRRMKASDAVNWAIDRPQHYRWDGEETWHYFMYEPIRWRIVEMDGSEVLLLADEEMDCAPYNEEAAEVTWEDSTIRSFLNGYDETNNAAGISYAERNSDSFYGTAFSEEEKACIIESMNENPANSNYGTDCGGETADKVFLLSSADVYSSDAASRHGFYQGNGVDDPAKRFSPTMYAMARGTWYSPVDKYRGNGFWFMRTNGYTRSNVSYICDFGYIYARGTFVTCNDAGILPAVRVDLSKASLENAGTRTSVK